MEITTLFLWSPSPSSGMSQGEEKTAKLWNCVSIDPSCFKVFRADLLHPRGQHHHNHRRQPKPSCPQLRLSPPTNHQHNRGVLLFCVLWIVTKGISNFKQVTYFSRRWSLKNYRRKNRSFKINRKVLFEIISCLFDKYFRNVKVRLF